MLSTMDTSTQLTGKKIQVRYIGNAKVNGLSNARSDYIVDAWEELKPAILHYNSTTETRNWNYLNYMESTRIYSRVYPVEMWNHHDSVDFEIFNAILLILHYKIIMYVLFCDSTIQRQCRCIVLSRNSSSSELFRDNFMSKF